MSDQPESSSDFYDRVDEACSLLLARETDAALEIIDGLQAENPDSPETIYLMGLAAVTLDELGRGLVLIEAAHKADPDCLEYSEALASLHTRVGNLTEGLYYAKLSTALEPHPHARNLLPADFSNYFKSLENANLPRHHINGLIKMAHHLYEDAAREFDRHLQIVPGDVDTHREFAGACLKLGQFENAINHAATAANNAPEDCGNQLQAGRVCQAIGAFAPAAFHFKNVLDNMDAPLPLAAAAFSLADTLPDLSADTRQELRKAIAAHGIKAPGRPNEAMPSTERKAKIHIAYLSNALADVDMMAFLEPILRYHDRSRFEVHLYQQTQGESAFKQQMANRADASRYVWNLDDETGAIVIGGDEIDILVDLCSPETDNRAGLLAMHPSSIQVGIAGFGGAGLPWINHIIGDAAYKTALDDLLCAGQSLHSISPSIWSSSPSQMLPELTPPPATQSGEITFGAICDLSSLSERAVEVLTQLLKATPGSRVLFGATGHLDGYPRRRIGELFAATGVADRIDVFDENRQQDKFSVDHDFWRRIDLLVVPGAAHRPIRLLESLWMGVPVVALNEDAHIGCAAKSVLQAAERAEWVAETVEDLTATVQSISGDIDKLASLRSKLRDSLKSTALFNPRVKVRALETIYQELVEARDKAAE